MAVKDEAVAWPLPSVVAVVLVVPLANVPEAPDDGAVKVTVAPETGLPDESVTSATSPEAKGAPTVADWPDPDTTATLAGPLETLVSAKVVLVAPGLVAVTE